MIFFTKFIVFIVFTGMFLIKFYLPIDHIYLNTHVNAIILTNT